MTTDTLRGAGGKLAGAPAKRSSGRAGASREPKAKVAGARQVNSSRKISTYLALIASKVETLQAENARLRDKMQASIERLREIEQRMFVADRFGDEFFVVQEEGSDRCLVYSAADHQLAHPLSIDSRLMRTVSFSADTALVVEPTKVQEGEGLTVLSGPLDRSKVTMKPAVRSLDERRRSTLSLLGIDPNNPRSR
ncbi:hypothetical protein [Burkholderia ambifaria]|uniref:hypothetical protein n=1 Tax=Burkholderia ambifaria TaxID=152480 RepID=UPI00158C7AE8|nr:hypothetical protein [Burkholderia ambifaria]